MKKIWFLAISLLWLSACGPHPQKLKQKIEKGQNLSMMADYNGAIEAFTDAIEYDPTAYEAYFERGSAYFNKRNFKKAVEDFLQAVELKPDFSSAWFSLGLIMEIESDQEMACYYFKKAKEFGRPNMGDYLKKCPQ